MELTDSKFISVRILSLEDSLPDAELILQKLVDEGYQFVPDIATNEKEFSYKLQHNPYDLILSDFQMPSFNGLTALELAKRHAPDVPFICVSGSIGEELAVELLKQGAADYVLKDRLEKLPLAVHRALREAHERKALNSAEQQIIRLSEAVQQSPVSIYITDIKGIIIYVNKKAFQTTGYTEEELIGKSPKEFFHNLSSVGFFEQMLEPLRAGKEWKGEIPYRIKNGDLIWTLTSVSPIYNELGMKTNYLALMEDITETKKLTEALIDSKKKAEASDRLKTAFMNNISHEVRTPLNGILGFGELMMDPDLTEDDKIRYLRILNASGDRLLRTINNYMDISLIVSGNLEVRKSICCPAEIVEVLIQSFLEAARLKGITIEAHYPARLKNFLVSTDKDLLNKILIHLLDNALKFSNQGKVMIGFDQRDEVLEFFVKDHGVGVAPEKQEQIFKQFIQGDTSLTRNYEGSGLGLSIVKGMVELLGGHIHLKSKPGVGSEFYFSIAD